MEVRKPELRLNNEKKKKGKTNYNKKRDITSKNI